LPITISEAEMAGSEVRSVVLILGVVVLLAVGLYLVDPSMCGMMRNSEGFADTLSADSTASQPATGPNAVSGAIQAAAVKAAPAVLPTPTANLMGAATAGTASMASPALGVSSTPGSKGKEGFANLEDVSGPASFGSSESPSGCYSRDQLTPSELLPKDANSVWAQQNPMGTGSLKGKNFLSAGALVGVNTVGESLRNANYQLRSEPPNPQVAVSVFNNSTIEPDINRRDLEIS
jgi:hypothetical protein